MAEMPIFVMMSLPSWQMMESISLYIAYSARPSSAIAASSAGVAGSGLIPCSIRSRSTAIAGPPSPGRPGRRARRITAACWLGRAGRDASRPGGGAGRLTLDDAVQVLADAPHPARLDDDGGVLRLDDGRASQGM